MAIPSNRTPVRVARGAAVKFTETIDGVAGAGAKALEDGEIVWDETNEKFQIKVGGSSSTTLKDHTVDTSNLAPKASPTFTGTVAIPNITNVETAITGKANLSGASFTGDVSIELDDYLFVGGTTLTTATLLGRSTDATNGGTYGELRQGADEDLYIQGAAGKTVAITSFTDSVYGPDSERMAEFIDQGAVKLYHNNVQKFTTKATGVEISGALEATNIGTTTFLDDVVVNWGTGVDGRIFYTNSDNTFNIRCPGGLADVVIGTGTTPGSGGSTKFTNGSGTTEYASFDNNGGLTVKKRAVGEITGLTDAATIDVDFKDSNNFSVTLGDNRTLGQPSNQTAGQSGSIFVTQDGTGSRTLAYHADWKWAGGTAPTLSTAADAVDRIDYIVAAANKIHAVATLAVA